MAITDFTGRKSLAAIAADTDGRGGKLAKALGPSSLVCLGIGRIIGASIPLATWIRLVVWLAIWLVIYFD